jgi:hypothetical protein
MDGFELPDGTRQELDEAGFTIIPGPVAAEDSLAWVPPMTQP